MASAIDETSKTVMQIPLASPAYVLISFDNSLTCDEITLTDEDEDKGGEEDGGFN